MATTAQSPEQRELALVGKVEMRVALADSDAKLESTLKTYLAPLLLKLLSQHVSVRNKVISICQHITTRTKPESIRLPVAALVKQFTDQDSTLIRHFDLLYIQQGIGRLTPTERAELLPTVLKGFASSGTHGSQVFHLLLRLLDAFAFPPRGSRQDVDLRSQMQISDGEAAYIAKWLGKLLLFTPQKGTNQHSCPGLTQEEVAFLSLSGKEDTWNPGAGGMNLLRTKTLTAKLLTSGVFNDSERFLPALFASADPASAISDAGDDMLKRALPTTDFEGETLIKQFYELYFGAEDKPRVKAPLRLKILGLLVKSTKSATFSVEVMKLVDDGVASQNMDGEDVVMTNGITSNTNLGREATKLRTAIFAYINFVARHGSQDTLHVIAPRVVNRLRDFIENQGWPKPGPSEDLSSRGYAYEVIGLLVKAGPRSIIFEEQTPTLDLLRWLFDSLAKDTTGNAVTVSIEESLSNVLSAVSRSEIQASERNVLEDLLIDQMNLSADLDGNKRVRSTRYVALRFANRCLPYSSVKGRWIDVLGLGSKGDKAEVKEEAERGLNPYWYRMLNGTIGNVKTASVEFPTFEATMGQFFQGRTTSTTTEPSAVAKQIGLSNPACFKELTDFARRMLYQEAMQEDDIAAPIDSEWERRLDVSAESDLKTRQALRSHIVRTIDQDRKNIATLQFAIFDILTAKPSFSIDGIIEFTALCPDALVQNLVPFTDTIMPVLQENNFKRRSTAANLFGILASHTSANREQIRNSCDQLLREAQSWKSAFGSASSRVHGALVALGYFYSRLVCRGRSVGESTSYPAFLKLVLEILAESRDDLLKEASYTVLTQLCMFRAISTGDIEEIMKLKTVIDKLYETAKGGNEPAILCLGAFSMILTENNEDEDNDLKYLTEQLHKLHEIRQAELHFTVGEALSYLACGWKSGALATKLDISGVEPPTIQRTSTLEGLIEQMLKDCVNTKPSLKKAAVMWLLCIVQFCGNQPEVQSRLSSCQTAFKRCLSDRDELVQETASRGLGLVYEKGDRRLKDDLVRDLVSSFSSDKQTQLAGSVSADTQLFEPGALPTGDGSVSTYKDIMSLASEVGDSSLVYRFMSMASSNAIWSSRAAFGRFGLSSVLSDSSVDGYLANNPKLYPKLFRYRFDPNGGVQRSMNEIWNALVKDPTATVDQHFDAIMEDLLTSILGKEWRVRQASCAAIADLVSGRPLKKYEPYLERIWTQCFKVLDDIKESVRAAAASLARTLTGVLTRALEADHSSTKDASASLSHVLPFLLSPSGMESSAKDVQTFAVGTMLEIIKKANAKTLRPFIPELVERLIGLLSSLEPEAVNYIHLNASKYNLTEQKIDDMRLSSVRSSPLMEAIERCLDLLDEDCMKQLKPRLENAMKSAVGLPSKVGSSRVLVSLSTRRMVLFSPHSDDALKLIEKLVVDRNETVSSSYAMAAGYVARGASEKQLLRLVAFAQKIYFESEGDREGAVPQKAIAAGEIMYALSKHANDRFNSIASSVLPFVFVAKHDPHEIVKEQFQNTWNETVGGSRVVLLYAPEIIALCTSYLESPQWTLKHTSAWAVADAVMAISATQTQIPEDIGAKLWPAVEKALSGKTWEGKEVVLSAFVKFVEAGREFYAQKSSVKSTIIKIAVREAKRQNATFRPYALKAIGKVAIALRDDNMFPLVLPIAEPFLAPPDGEDKMEVDDEASKTSDSLKDTTSAAAAEALFASINPYILPTDALSKAIDSAVIAASEAIPQSSAQLRRSIYTGVTETFNRIGKAEKGEKLRPDYSALKRLLFSRMDDIEALRLLRADAIIAIAEASPAIVANDLGSEVEALLAEEKSPVVRERLNRALRK